MTPMLFLTWDTSLILLNLLIKINICLFFEFAISRFLDFVKYFFCLNLLSFYVLYHVRNALSRVSAFSFFLSAGVHVSDISIAVAMLMGRHNLGLNSPSLPSHTLPFQPHHKLALWLRLWTMATKNNTYNFR